MYKREGEKGARRAVSKFCCREPPLGSLNTLERDLVFKDMIILFSIANIKYLKGGFFFKKNMKASKFSITFGNSSSCFQAQVPEDSDGVETALQGLLLELLDTAISRLGDAPDRQPGVFLPWELSQAVPAWGRQSAPGNEFPAWISSLLLPTVLLRAGGACKELH